MLPAFFISVGGLVAIVAAGVAFYNFSHYYNSNKYENQKNVNPDRSRMREIIGCCSHCKAEVMVVHGYLLPCNHPIHYTCATSVKRELRGCTDPTMICKICISASVKRLNSGTNEGSRKRTNKSNECANCGKIITDNPSKLACGHTVHESCWKRMEETSTTCPRCMG